MFKTISAYVNVPRSDYNEDLLIHVVELMKESLREQSMEIILENTWKVQKQDRKLYKNEQGDWELLVNEPIDSTDYFDSEASEILEVMTVTLSANAEIGI